MLPSHAEAAWPVSPHCFHALLFAQSALLRNTWNAFSVLNTSFNKPFSHTMCLILVLQRVLLPNHITHMHSTCIICLFCRSTFDKFCFYTMQFECCGVCGSTTQFIDDFIYLNKENYAMKTNFLYERLNSLEKQELPSLSCKKFNRLNFYFLSFSFARIWSNRYNKVITITCRGTRQK